MIKEERANIILRNVLDELYEKTFDMNDKEFILWLETEIGMTEDEIKDMNIIGGNNE